MKFKYFVYAVLFIGTTSSFLGCKDSNPEPELPKEDCYTCDKERVVGKLTDVEAVVKKYSTGNPSAEPLFIITTKEVYLNSNDNNYHYDSVFVSCPSLPKEFREVGKRIIISGDIKSCTGMLADIFTNPELYYGQKLDLTSIKER